MRQFTPLLIFICLQLPLRVFSQSFSPITANQDNERTKLNQNYNLWYSYNFLNYNYTYQRQCHVCCWINACGDENFPWSVQVNYDSYGGGYTGVKAIDSKNNPKYEWLTVEAVFEELQTALNDNNMLMEADYDYSFGYPSRYRIQYGSNPNTGQEGFAEGSLYNGVGLSGSQRDFYNTAFSQWSRAFPPGAARSYSFSYTDKSSAATAYSYPVFVTVEWGSVTYAYDSRGYILTPTDRAYVPTIDTYLNDISVQLNDPPADWINNSYDQNVGYPTVIKMIPYYNTGSPFLIEIYIDSFSFQITPYN